jgi:mono/diheme cytochrome c family protein
VSQLQNHHNACSSAEAPEAESMSALRQSFFIAKRGASNVVVRLAILLLLVTTSSSLAEDGSSSPLEQRGRALAERMCSQCHAVGRSGESPHVGAPAFRALDRRVDLDSFMERLREGLSVGHPDMPTFRFTREDARAFLLYLRSIQAP